MREKFKELLDNEYTWPTEFHFKFIVASQHVDQVKELLNQARIELVTSRNKTYTSVNAWMKLASSDEVIYVYDKLQQVPGIISL